MIDPSPSGLLGGVPEPALVSAARTGDPAALDALVRTWSPTVLRWCARLGGGRIDAEDAAHDVFERVFRKLPGLRDPEAFPAWLFQTTRGVLAQHRRRAWVRRWIGPLLYEPAAAEVHDPEVADVHAALDALAPELREVVVLHDVEGRSDAEVAALLAIPLGTVKSRLRRARAGFVAGFGDRGHPPPAPEGAR